MNFEAYRLPDGRVVQVDASASKGAAEIGFTEKGGRIVTATKVTRKVVEAAEQHADRCIAAAQHLEQQARRLKDHAKAIRENTRTGRFYTDAEIENFDMHKACDIESAARRAVALAKGEG